VKDSSKFEQMIFPSHYGLIHTVLGPCSFLREVELMTSLQLLSM